jgi:hypothetical protein
VPITIPPSVFVASAQSGALPALQPGDIVDAVVVGLLADGRVRISISNKIMDVVSQVSLEPGTSVQLAVKSTITGLALSLLEPGSTASSTGATVSSANGAAAPTGTASPLATTATVPGDITNTVHPSAALAQAVRSAASQQNGLAPLFANMSEVARAPSLPEPVRAAIAQLQAFQASTAHPVTADDVRQAFARSGLLLETRLASGSVASADAAETAAPDLKAALLVFRQVLKGWLGGLPTVSGAVAAAGTTRQAGTSAPQNSSTQPQATTNPQVTAQARAAVGATASIRLPSPLAGAEASTAREANTSAALTDLQSTAPPLAPGQSASNAPKSPVHTAVASNATEAKFAAAAVIAAAGEAIEDAAIDARLFRAATTIVEAEAAEDFAANASPLRAALGAARERILPSMLDHPLLVALAESEVATSSTQQGAPAASARIVDAMGTAVGRAPEPIARPDAAGAPVPGKSLVPPYGGGPLAAQPPAQASTKADAEPRAIAERLLVDTDAALARHTLLQAASLPDGGDAGRTDRTEARWTFEIPLATPQGTAVAQFEIARDGRRGASADASVPAWRARFTLDVEPMGPVHVQIALNHTRAAVTLWAERAASAARLREDAPMLTQALREAELEPGDVLVRTGEPPRFGTAAAGRFLDRAS